ncbi:hypothetical protein OROMI_009397 [Orobanche minor]
MSRRIHFVFLEEIHQRFVRTYGRAVLSAQAYGMNDEFSRVISQQMEYYSNDPNADRINRIRGEMSQGKIGMEYVDMYLVHWPVKLKPWACSAVPNEKYFDKLDIVGTWAGMAKCVQMGLCKAIGVTESYSILLVLLICVAKVAKSAFDKPLVEHEDIDDDGGSEEPTEGDHGVDLQQPLLIKIDSSDSHQK